MLEQVPKKDRSMIGQLENNFNLSYLEYKFSVSVSSGRVNKQLEQITVFLQYIFQLADNRNSATVVILMCNHVGSGGLTDNSSVRNKHV